MAANVIVPAFTEAPDTVVGGTPQSVFPFEFPFWDAADIIVRINAVALDPSEYTVEGLLVQNGETIEGGFGSGIVTLNVPVTTATVTIDRFVVGTRETVFAKNSPLPMPALNADLNKVVARQQDIDRKIASLGNVDVDLGAVEAAAAAAQAAASDAVDAAAAAAAGLPLKADTTGDNINVTAANGSATPGGEDIASLRFGTNATTVSFTDLSVARASGFHFKQRQTKAAVDNVWPEDGVNQFTVFFDTDVFPTPARSASFTNTFSLTDAFQTVATTTMTTVTPNNLFLFGTGPALVPGTTVLSGGATFANAEYRIIETVGGVDNGTVFIGTFIVTEVSTGPQVLSLTHTTAPNIAAYNSTRVASGTVGYRVEVRRTFGANVSGLSFTLATRRQTTSYQKGPAIFRMNQYDDSQPGVVHDGVAVQAFGVGMPGGLLRHVWAAHLYGIMLPGADGYKPVLETAGENYGSDELLMDRETTKIVHNNIAGVGLMTAGSAYVGAAGGTFQNMIWSRHQFIREYMMRIESSFAIKKQGSSWTVAIGTDLPDVKGGLVLHAKPMGGATSAIFDVSSSGGTGFAMLTLRSPGVVARTIGMARDSSGDFLVTTGEDLDSTASPAIARFRAIGTARSLHLFSPGTFASGGENFIHIPEGTTPTVSAGFALYSSSNQPFVRTGGGGSSALMMHLNTFTATPVTNSGYVVCLIGGVAKKIMLAD